MVLFWYQYDMPPKIRELIRNLESAGFRVKSIRGSHRRFVHSSGLRVTVSGNTGKDAKKYQIEDVEWAIAEVSDEEK